MADQVSIDVGQGEQDLKLRFGKRMASRHGVPADDASAPEARRVSLVALNGMAFDLATPHRRMMATVLAGISGFESELTLERIRSGIATAKARGKRLGRQPGQRPKSDRLALQVLAPIAQGRSCRLVGRKVGLSKNTVADIIKRNRSCVPNQRH